jgi:4'-phosphopantetheinyl transferase
MNLADPAVPPLHEGDAHVWIGRLDISVTGNAPADSLSLSEALRADSYRFAEDRERFVFSRVMLRELLGAYLDATPSGIHLRTGDYDKPYSAEARALGIEFNSSRSRELSVCAFCRGQEIGVDVEFVRPDLEFDSMARAAFGEDDCARIAAAAAADRPRLFFDLWTRKEAAAKATGEGLNADTRTIDRTGISLRPVAVPAGYVAHVATARRLKSTRVMDWNPSR